MIRRKFLMTAGVTVAAISMLGPSVWADGPMGATDASADVMPRGSGWMHGFEGGCANVIGAEPVLPNWAAA